MTFSSLPKPVPDSKSSDALVPLHQPEVERNPRIERLNSIIATWERRLEEYDQRLRPGRYRPWSVKWLLAHLSFAVGSLWNRSIHLMERVSVASARVLRRMGASSSTWQIIDEREKLSSKVETLKLNLHVARAVAEQARRGEAVDPRLERLPKDLQSAMLSFLTPKDQSSLISTSRSLNQLSLTVDHLMISADQFLSVCDDEFFLARNREQIRDLYLFLDEKKPNIDLILDKIELNFKNLSYLSISHKIPNLQYRSRDHFDEREDEAESRQEGVALTRLLLWGLSSTHVETLKAIVQRSPNLTVLELCDSEVNDQDLLALAQYGKQIRTLAVNGSGRYHTSSWKAVMRGCSQLRELYLWRMPIELVLGAPQLSVLFLGALLTCPRSISEIVHYCRDQKGLKQFIIRTGGLRIDDDDLSAISQAWPQLQKLYLDSTRGAMTDEGLESLARGCRDLDYLQLTDFKFTPRSFQILASYCPRLTSVWEGGKQLESWRAESLTRGEN